MEEKNGNTNVDEKVAENASVVNPVERVSSRANGSRVAIIFSSLALVLGAGGLALGWMGYEKASTPITFLNSGADGNSLILLRGQLQILLIKCRKVWFRL